MTLNKSTLSFPQLLKKAEEMKDAKDESGTQDDIIELFEKIGQMKVNFLKIHTLRNDSDTLTESFESSMEKLRDIVSTMDLEDFCKCTYNRNKRDDMCERLIFCTLMNAFLKNTDFPDYDDVVKEIKTIFSKAPFDVHPKIYLNALVCFVAELARLAANCLEPGYEDRHKSCYDCILKIQRILRKADLPPYTATALKSIDMSIDHLEKDMVENKILI
ncbi:hypothetical protein ACOME3_000669 [Neoechinorhynchus agilis]